MLQMSVWATQIVFSVYLLFCHCFVGVAQGWDGGPERNGE